MQSNRHCTVQIPHALHRTGLTLGFGHFARGTAWQVFPCPSRIACFGQTEPQVPQETQRRTLMVCRWRAAPAMASTGQTRLHAVQPMQDSVMK
jgi:hypothetical protein